MSEEKNSVKLADIESTETPKIVMDRQAIEAAVNLNSQTMYKNYQYLRVYLEGKGCDGFTYGVSFDDLDCKDQIFLQNLGDQTVKLICDPDSYQFLKGSTITFEDSEIGRGFVVNNPRHRRFRGKFYKKKVWQDRLDEKRKLNTDLPNL